MEDALPLMKVVKQTPQTENVTFLIVFVIVDNLWCDEA